MQKLFVILLLTSWMSADIVPKKILAKSCLESYQNTYISHHKHKAFVYAREKQTDKDRCNWGYGYSSTKEAIEIAMKGCQSVVLNAECILIDTDGVFSVKEGVFSLLEPLKDTPLSTEHKKSLEAEAKKIILGNCLPFFTKNYLDSKGYKAFAYSIDKILTMPVAMLMKTKQKKSPKKMR